MKGASSICRSLSGTMACKGDSACTTASQALESWCCKSASCCCCDAAGNQRGMEEGTRGGPRPPAPSWQAVPWRGMWPASSGIELSSQLLLSSLKPASLQVGTVHLKRLLQGICAKCTGADACHMANELRLCKSFAGSGRASAFLGSFIDTISSEQLWA